MGLGQAQRPDIQVLTGTGVITQPAALSPHMPAISLIKSLSRVADDSIVAADVDVVYVYACTPIFRARERGPSKSSEKESPGTEET